MKNIILMVICIFTFQTVVIAQEIVQTDIIITPKTIHSFGFSGMIGGKGEIAGYESDQRDWLSWSIGNNTPFRTTPSGDIVFSTCIGDFSKAENWHERMRISKYGDLILRNGIGLRITSPDGRKTVRIFLDNSGNLKTVVRPGMP